MPTTQYRLLVVDDYPDARTMLSDILRAHGHFVLEACNADAAITLLRSEDSFSAVLTDVEMPGTMDGVALAALVRQSWPDSKVIAMSANDNHRVRMPDGVPFVRKPYVVEALLHKLDRLLMGNP